MNLNTYHVSIVFHFGKIPDVATLSKQAAEGGHPLLLH